VTCPGGVDGGGRVGCTQFECLGDYGRLLYYYTTKGPSALVRREKENTIFVKAEEAIFLTLALCVSCTGT